MFECPVCKERFQNVGALKIHFRRNHAEKYVNRCPFCNRTFKNIISHYYHVGRRDEKHAAIYLLLSTYSRSAKTGTIREIKQKALNVVQKEYSIDEEREMHDLWKRNRKTLQLH